LNSKSIKEKWDANWWKKVWKLRYIHEHCVAKKNSKIYKYKKSHLHASLHGNGLNVFQFGIV
jgi:hypothetical protein